MNEQAGSSGTSALKWHEESAIRLSEEEQHQLEVLKVILLSPRLVGKYMAFLYQYFCTAIEQWLPVLTIIAFILGIFGAKYFPVLSDVIDSQMNMFLDIYGFIAPFAIYFILTPSLARILSSSTGKGGKFATYAVIFLSVRRFFSLIWAVIFTVIIFDFPLVVGGTSNFWPSIEQSVTSLGQMMFESPYFYAMYAAIVTIIIARKLDRINRILFKTATLIETAGQFLVPVVPLFMLVIGIYVYGLPRNVENQIRENSKAVLTFQEYAAMKAENPEAGDILTPLEAVRIRNNDEIIVEITKGDGVIVSTGMFSENDKNALGNEVIAFFEQYSRGVDLQEISILGLKIDSATPSGMLIGYVVISLLIGVACFIWHFAFLTHCKYTIRGFSIMGYFTKYWIKVYPLLWATSSEAFATPLNLYLVKKYYPDIRADVRRFIVGVGSYLNINGTMICIIVLAGYVAKIIGIELSLLQFLLCIPLVFIIGFGVPGIPGELLLFGGPLVQLLGFPPQIASTFLALYLGLQLGLPDSFRTGNNSTDDCLMALIMNEKYLKKFL